jgi:Domain of unknown function (DU1801)
MVSSAATNVEQYLAELPEERRKVLTAMRKLIRRNLPKGYDESMAWGMICYSVPLSTYPDTYNGQPLCYAGLAAQKHYNSLYLTGPYTSEEQDAELRAAFKAAGKKLDMGKGCVRFQTLDDLVLDPIAAMIASTPPDEFIEIYEAARAKANAARRKTAAKNAAAKKAASKKAAKRA